MKKINFQIEVSRILELLSNDIYDSPYALLRENIQNAYDAILMRMYEEGSSEFSPKIMVTIKDKVVSISDNGIGMTEEVLANNFWKAGSSGKNNEEARKAGVVGTFGIGAMANFGVAKRISVVSRRSGGCITLETFADRENLSVTEECVSFQASDKARDEPGTTITAIIDDDKTVTEDGALEYLLPYVRYVQIPILLNDKIISQNDFNAQFDVSSSSLEQYDVVKVDVSDFSFQISYKLSKNGSVKLKVSDITYNKSPLIGDIVLTQGEGSIYGLRNYFGLAHLPVPNNFNFGGIVNLNNLHPTAGREALSRESIDMVSRMLNIIEGRICDEVSSFDVIDNNNYFMNYIVNFSRYDLAGKIKIDVKPDLGPVALESVSTELHSKKVFYYGGRDQSTILAFGNENSYLLHLSQNNPRRKIQHFVLKKKQIEEVPDHPSVIGVIDRNELSLAEAALIIRVSSILSEDYLLADNLIQFAEISHKVPTLVKKEGNTLKVYLSRDSSAIQQVIAAYTSAYEIFGGFVKDFIRNYLYQKFSDFIPSSTRQGAEALHKILQKNRELFKYETSDFGEMDSLLGDYVSGELELSEVIKRSVRIQRTHTQSVGRQQIGSAEEEIPSLTAVVAQQEVNTNILTALPAIDRGDTETDKKVLRTSIKYPHLNNFSLFLSLSDSVYRRQVDFFYEPHTTKVIWGMHRIVYIFTHASSNLSLYYDIELRERLKDEKTGGAPIPTTTILTKNKIFIPVPDDLMEYFNITEGIKEFYVRHDIITDFSKSK